MTDSVKVKGFAFGAGAFLEDGTLMEFEFDNCSPTYRVRSLDAMRIKKLKDAGIDLDDLAPLMEMIATPVFDKDGLPTIDDDGNAVVNRTMKVTEGINAWLARNAEKFAAICEELIVSFDGVKREDGSIVESNKDTIRGHGGYHDFVVALIRAAKLSAKAQVKNSKSSSDGTSEKTPDAGEPTSEPVIETD